jgi:(R,R)-butanediol dehydrogenase / meso-butanediol dehydrogenase / diacetyl reductase
MRVVRVAEDGSVAVAQADPEPVGEGEVRIDVVYCGICGSDLHMLHASPAPAGLVMGHEFTGVVSEVGPGVTKAAVGDRVAVRPIDRCGECVACTSGEGICMLGLMRGPGLGRQGGFAESTVVPEGMLFPLPGTVTDEGGALVEPLAVAVRGVERSGAQPSDPVCVLGAGPIGFMTTVALQARGFTNVVVIDPNVARREKVASALDVPVAGSEEAVAFVPTTLGEAPRVVIDCSGHPSGIPLAVGLLPQMGTLAVVGIPFEPVPTDYLQVASKELKIVGSLAYSERDFEESIDHIAHGRVPVDRIVTSVSTLEDAWQVIQDLSSGHSTDVKVLLKP